MGCFFIEELFHLAVQNRHERVPNREFDQPVPVDPGGNQRERAPAPRGLWPVSGTEEQKLHLGVRQAPVDSRNRFSGAPDPRGLPRLGRCVRSVHSCATHLRHRFSFTLTPMVHSRRYDWDAPRSHPGFGHGQQSIPVGRKGGTCANFGGCHVDSGGGGGLGRGPGPDRDRPADGRALADRAPDGTAAVEAPGAALAIGKLVVSHKQGHASNRSSMKPPASTWWPTSASTTATSCAPCSVFPASATDAEIVLAGYQRWGPLVPDHLIGDFAFAVWDARQRRLFAARDPFGVRPLVYRRLPEAACCSPPTSRRSWPWTPPPGRSTTWRWWIT